MSDIDSIAREARQLVIDFAFRHQAVAIPALIGACVIVAVEIGCGEIVRGSLQNAVELSRTAERAVKKGSH